MKNCKKIVGKEEKGGLGKKKKNLSFIEEKQLKFFNSGEQIETDTPINFNKLRSQSPPHMFPRFCNMNGYNCGLYLTCTLSLM